MIHWQHNWISQYYSPLNVSFIVSLSDIIVCILKVELLDVVVAENIVVVTSVVAVIVQDLSVTMALLQ